MSVQVSPECGQRSPAVGGNSMDSLDPTLPADRQYTATTTPLDTNIGGIVPKRMVQRRIFHAKKLPQICFSRRKRGLTVTSPSFVNMVGASQQCILLHPQYQTDHHRAKCCADTRRTNMKQNATTVKKTAIA